MNRVRLSMATAVEVQHTLGGKHRILRQLALPGLLPGRPLESGSLQFLAHPVVGNAVEEDLQPVGFVVPDQRSPFKRHFPFFFLPDFFQFQPVLAGHFRQLEKTVACRDDRLAAAGIVLPDQVHRLLHDFHFTLAGIGAYLVQDAADEQGTAVPSGPSCINFMDGVCAAGNVPFQAVP